MAFERPFNMSVLRELFTNHELLYREDYRPQPSDPKHVRSVAILGGGTAGWLTALALRHQLRWLKVTVIETPSIPVVGVGEASVPSLVAFLHRYLGLDILELDREVRPTWKQGIRFEWGMPGKYVFQAPFDWEVNGIGMLGSMAETKNVSSFTLQAHLMDRGTTPILKSKKGLSSFLPVLAFAYHLENEKFVRYLRDKAVERGITHRQAKIADAEVAQVEGDDEPHVTTLTTEDGETLDFDFYVDCSGFGSFLLEKKLGAGYRSYASSLFTDRAFAFNAPHGGDIKPYTTARTMENGWCWTIPMHESNHHGYAYSSAHASDEEAAAEVKTIWPEIEHERFVRFRSGRHDRLWIGNVYAVGNSYAFVEPLESTGIMMIQRAICALVRAFPIGPESGVIRRFLNESIGNDWDRLRWFLAAHFKFNKRLDTPFWKACRADVDISALDNALALYEACGPLSLLPRAMRKSVEDQAGFLFYGLHGLDTILLGQKVPHREIKREPKAVWKKRQAIANDFARRGLPYPKAIQVMKDHPEWLRQIVDEPGGWANKMAAFL